MNYLATAALMLTFGVSSVCAQQVRANMTLSGTAAPSTIDLGTGRPYLNTLSPEKVRWAHSPFVL